MNPTVKKLISNYSNIQKVTLCLTFICCQPSFAQTTEVIDGIIYDIVSIKITTPTYDTSKPPVCAKVKYNKLCPLIITSDDMGTSELVNSWAFFNGYPAFSSNTYSYISKGDNFLESPYREIELKQQIKELKRSDHQPLTYTDGTGGVRRFTATSAIWPYEVENKNYMLINGKDAKTMIRTGWSFAQHDVDKEYAANAETIASRFKDLSENWEDIVGIGIKVMVEPNGNHKYIDAGKQSDEICWNIFQNGQLPNYPEEKNARISDWTTGSDWTSFTHKPEATTIRFFFQNKEKEFEDRIEKADGSLMILGGTHGLSSIILNYLRDIVQPSDKYWVTGADEVWEYYHLYNTSKITDIIYENEILSFNVKIPRYKKHQFRELTLNIPGVTNGTSCSFSNNIITGAGKQNRDYYTINFGMENRIYSYIEELITYYRAHQHNSYVKNDAQYLINLLSPGDKKKNYQAMLDAAPSYCSYQITTDIGNKELASGAQDEATPITFCFPKYVLDGTDLFETTPNETEPYYMITYTPDKGRNYKTINYKEVIHDVVFFIEGEDLDNVQYHPVNTNNINNKNKAEYYVYHWSSNAAGAIIKDPTNIATLQPGSYKITVATGATNDKENNNTIYTFKLGDNSVYSFTSNKTGINEYFTDLITVNEEQTLTLEAANPNTSRWIDYLYIQKFDSETNIINPTLPTNSKPTRTFNLMGMKVDELKKGIYITNGNKIIVR